MSNHTTLPSPRPLFPPRVLDDLISTKPVWLSIPFDPADGSETVLSNADRNPIDLIKLGIDVDLDDEDAAGLVRQGWDRVEDTWQVRGKKCDVVIYHHPNGAMIVSSDRCTTVRFCPGRVVFGRNDRIADVTPYQIGAMLVAFTEHLMPRTTRSRRRQQTKTAGMEVRRFFLWTLRRVDVCVQAKVPSMPDVFRVFRLARSQRCRGEPLLWKGQQVVKGLPQGGETGLTWGVPDISERERIRRYNARAKATAEERAAMEDEGRSRSGRISISFYDKGRQQRTPQGYDTTIGAPLDEDRFLRVEVSFRTLDACASLAATLPNWVPTEHEEQPVLLRVPKDPNQRDDPAEHGVSVELNFGKLHQIIQMEILDLMRFRLRKTKSKGRVNVRQYPQGWLEKMTKAEQDEILALARGEHLPSGDKHGLETRKAAMEVAMTRPDLVAGGISLYHALWPQVDQQLPAKAYGKALERKRKRSTRAARKLNAHAALSCVTDIASAVRREPPVHASSRGPR